MKSLKEHNKELAEFNDSIRYFESLVNQAKLRHSIELNQLQEQVDAAQRLYKNCNDAWIAEASAIIDKQRAEKESKPSLFTYPQIAQAELLVNVVPTHLWPEDEWREIEGSDKRVFGDVNMWLDEGVPKASLYPIKQNGETDTSQWVELKII